MEFVLVLIYFVRIQLCKILRTTNNAAFLFYFGTIHFRKISIGIFCWWKPDASRCEKIAQLSDSFSYKRCNLHMKKKVGWFVCIWKGFPDDISRTIRLIKILHGFFLIFSFFFFAGHSSIILIHWNCWHSSHRWMSSTTSTSGMAHSGRHIRDMRPLFLFAIRWGQSLA